MPIEVFRDRRHAGRVLAQVLTGYAKRPDVLVLALPTGGVPVAFEVAQALYAPLDVFIVRKLGVPGQPEYAMGAIASGGIRVLNTNVIHVLGISEDALAAVTAAEQAELARREALYRGDRPVPVVTSRSVILVDDGLTTGATLLSAVKALKSRHPARIVVAVPTASSEFCELMGHDADEVVCATTPEALRAAGCCYEDVEQTSDEQVRELLDLAWRGTPQD